MQIERHTVRAPVPYVSYLNSSDNGHQLPNLGWNYPTDMLHMVHEHWRGFPIPEVYYSVFFFLYYCFLMLISFFGNGLVLWIFATSKNLRTPSNLLIINLGVFDLVMWLNTPHYLMNSVTGHIVGGDLGCNLYALFGAISGVGAAITNAFIAFDRYRTISNPIDGRLNFAQIIILIIVSWLWVIPFTVLPFIKIWGTYIPEGFLTACSFDYLTDTPDTRYFIRTMFVWAYCIPMCLICSSYTKLFLHVRDHEQMLAEQAKKMNVKSLSANADPAAMSVELRIAKAAICIYMLYVLAWTPYAIVALLSTFGYRHLVTPFASMLPATTAKAVSCLDPWVYAVSHPKYRLELERRLPWLGIREKEVSSSSVGKESTSGDATTVSMDN